MKDIKTVDSKSCKEIYIILNKLGLFYKLPEEIKKYISDNQSETYEYDFNIGCKYAVHRMKHNPFCQMESKFGGEFNDATVKAIMDVKAKYIEAHWNEFYRPRN